MDAASFLKLLHVLAAFAFLAGLLGRWIALGQAAGSRDLVATKSLVELAGRFERWLVIPGSFAVLIAGLLTARALGYPLFGGSGGSGSSWLLVSLALFSSAAVLVPAVFIPRGRRFGAALAAAESSGVVTPALHAAFRDPVVAAAHAYELLAVVAVLVLMVLKPF